MIKLQGNMMPVEGYIGSVDGILEAVKSPAFEGDFGKYTLTHLKKKFMFDTIASAQAGNTRIQHVFEWPQQDARGVSLGGNSGIPLFRLRISGAKQFRVLGFDFLPSVRSVPLPDPARYGFDPDKLQYLRRHTFKLKALVMETFPSVTVAPRHAKKLFIPSTSAEKGYIMTSRPQSINPGGQQSTGGFAEWWSVWFSGPAKSHIKEATNLAEETIKATGQSIIRDATTGRFAKGTTIQMGYVNTARNAARMKMMMAAERVFETEGEDDWYDD